jgi:hypothetical protein
MRNREILVIVGRRSTKKYWFPTIVGDRFIFVINTRPPRRAVGDFVINTRPPQRAVGDFVIDTRPPQRAVGDFVINTRPPQRAVGDFVIDTRPLGVPLGTL